jgi:F-type H+-transporting ATPase subunit delta
MTEGKLSRRYSRAIFQLAQEHGEEEQVGGEIRQFHEAYSGTELQQVLTNPGFALGARKRILTEVTQGIELSILTSHFVALLLERDRLGHLPGIVSCYRRLLNAAKGRVEAKVVSAGPLEPAMINALCERLRGISGKDVVLQQETDPSLIGGLLIELEGRVYDGSVHTQLEKMKQRIARGY